MTFLRSAEERGLAARGTDPEPLTTCLNRSFEVGLGGNRHPRQCGRWPYSADDPRHAFRQYADGARPANARISLYQPLHPPPTRQEGLRASSAGPANMEMELAQMALAYVTWVAVRDQQTSSALPRWNEAGNPTPAASTRGGRGRCPPVSMRSTGSNWNPAPLEV